jgi:hypothetical protein
VTSGEPSQQAYRKAAGLLYDALERLAFRDALEQSLIDDPIGGQDSEP